MLADNIGFGDLGCYGSGGDLRGMPTPNLDDLADKLWFEVTQQA